MNGQQEGRLRSHTSSAADKYRLSRELLEAALGDQPQPDEKVAKQRLQEYQEGIDALKGKYPKIFIDIMKEIVVRDQASPKLLLGILKQVQQFSQPGSQFEKSIGAPLFGEGKPLKEFIERINEFSDALDIIPSQTELRIYDQISQTRAQVYGSSPRIETQASLRNDLDEYQYQAGRIMEKLFLQTDIQRLDDTLFSLPSQLKKLNKQLKEKTDSLKKSGAYRRNSAQEFSKGTAVFGKVLKPKARAEYESGNAPFHDEADEFQEFADRLSADDFKNMFG